MSKMLKVILSLSFMSFLMFGNAGAANADATIPADFKSPIIDSADVFTPSEEATLTDTIVNDFTKYGVVFVVETMETLNGQNLSAVAKEKANTLGVGDAAKDNGVFILLVKNDRVIRFELGKGVTPKISDSMMQKIINAEVTPQFKQSQYVAGLTAGMDSVGMEYSGTETVVSPADSNKNWGLIIGIPVGLIVLVLGGMLTYRNVTSYRHKKNLELRRATADKINTFMTTFKRSNEATAFRELPTGFYRDKYIADNHPDIFEGFVIIAPRKTAKEATRDGMNILVAYFLIDGSVYYDVNSFVQTYDTMSINEANVILDKKRSVRLEKERLTQIARNKEREKNRIIMAEKNLRTAAARKMWSDMPEAEKTSFKKASSKRQRMNVLPKSYSDNANSFPMTVLYPFLIASTFSNVDGDANTSIDAQVKAAAEASYSSYRGSSSSDYGSSSSRSSDSYSSPSYTSYDSSSYGGGSFDGGGASGGW